MWREPEAGSWGLFGQLNERRKETTMLGWSVLFFILAIVAGVFGFGGIAAASANIAQILFVVFLVLLVISALVGVLRGRSPL
jgi:uncharacterized membrane protein YtjA (UPF0391 family)